MMDLESGYGRPVQMHRAPRIAIGSLLVLGALFLVLAASAFLELKNPDHAFIAFLALMAGICGVIGIRLIRMRSGGYLFSAMGSIVGGILSFAIGVAFAIWGYYDGVARLAWIAVLPIVVGMLLCWTGRRRLIARLSTNREHERPGR